MRIAVAGGTGAVGRPVVEAVRAAGHEAVVMARSSGVDIITRAGLADALAGASAVIDVSNLTTISRRKAVAFFETGTRNLIDAGRRAGVSHHVALSIVGIDRVDIGYYAGKRHQEDLVLSSGVAASILRATQFYELITRFVAPGKSTPFAFVPQTRSQPIAAREVAQALTGLAEGEPVGMAPEIGGPEQAELTDLARQLLRARGSRRIVVPLRIPGAAGRAAAGGALLPAGPGPRGREKFGEWLARTDAGRAAPDGNPSEAGSTR